MPCSSLCTMRVPVCRRRPVRIFERFEAQTSRRPSAQEHGLGLSIVESFVELHDGTVHVEDAGERKANDVYLPLSQRPKGFPSTAWGGGGPGPER